MCKPPTLRETESEKESVGVGAQNRIAETVWRDTRLARRTLLIWVLVTTFRLNVNIFILIVIIYDTYDSIDDADDFADRAFHYLQSQSHTKTHTHTHHITHCAHEMSKFRTRLACVNSNILMQTTMGMSTTMSAPQSSNLVAGAAALRRVAKWGREEEVNRQS